MKRLFSIFQIYSTPLCLILIIFLFMPKFFWADAVSRHPINILIPLYSYPRWYDPPRYIWNNLVQTMAKLRREDKNVAITAIINPANGPGGAPNTDYLHGMDDLKKAGIKMIGYADTNYGAKNIGAVKNDIDLYADAFNKNDLYISGIFLDQTPASADKIGYYQQLYTYIKSKPNFDLAVLNPGTNFDESYLSSDTGDLFVVFENEAFGWSAYSPPLYLSGYPSYQFAALIHTVPTTSLLKTLVDPSYDRNIGYIYLTDDVLNNPWDTLPSFWQEEVDYIARLNSMIDPSPTPTPICVFACGKTCGNYPVSCVADCPGEHDCNICFEGFCVANPTVTSAPTATASPTATPTGTPTSSPTPTTTPTPTPTPTPTRTPTPTATPTEIPTATPAPAATATPTPTPTTTPIPTLTSTLTPTPTTACQKASGGDLNCDDYIDESDLTILVQQWYSPANGVTADCTAIPTPDISFSPANLTRLRGGTDCRVDEGDVSVLLLNWSPRPNP